MTEVPPFLFIVTSTALVLGVAIAVRGLIGFRPVAEVPALPTPLGSDLGRVIDRHGCWPRASAGSGQAARERAT